jgi:hypothetical protein
MTYSFLKVSMLPSSFKSQQLGIVLPKVAAHKFGRALVPATTLAFAFSTTLRIGAVGLSSNGTAPS